VPFGEYLPFQDVLESFGLRQVTGQIGGFSSGPGLATLSAPGIPTFAPLICYEVIFPGKAVDAKQRPEWIVNVTNDMWFGVTSGPYQHLAQTRMRAVEEGLPIIRVANSGVSAVIDARGRVVIMLPLDHDGIINGELPRALEPTLMARYGDLGFFSLLLFGFLAFSTRIKKEVRTPGLT
jgi:apolipoprotein N-acyltransferase